MREEMEGLMKECDELMELCISQLSDIDAIECLDETSLNAMQAVSVVTAASKRNTIPPAIATVSFLYCLLIPVFLSIFPNKKKIRN